MYDYQIFFGQNKEQRWARNFSSSIFNWLNLIEQTMLIYCVKCRKNTESLNSKISKTKSVRMIMQPKFAVCGIEKSRFLKEEEAKDY